MDRNAHQFIEYPSIPRVESIGIGERILLSSVTKVKFCFDLFCRRCIHARGTRIES